MTLKELERRIKKIQPVPIPTVTLHFKDGSEVTTNWGDGIRLGIADAEEIVRLSGPGAGLLNAILHPLPNRRIEDYED